MGGSLVHFTRYATLQFMGDLEAHNSTRNVAARPTVTIWVASSALSRISGVKGIYTKISCYAPLLYHCVPR